MTQNTWERLILSVEIKSSSFPGVPVTMSTYANKIEKEKKLLQNVITGDDGQVRRNSAPLKLFRTNIHSAIRYPSFSFEFHERLLISIPLGHEQHKNYFDIRSSKALCGTKGYRLLYKEPAHTCTVLPSKGFHHQDVTQADNFACTTNVIFTPFSGEWRQARSITTREGAFRAFPGRTCIAHHARFVLRSPERREKIAPLLYARLYRVEGMTLWRYKNKLDYPTD